MRGEFRSLLNPEDFVFAGLDDSAGVPDNFRAELPDYVFINGDGASLNESLCLGRALHNIECFEQVNNPERVWRICW